MEHLPISNQEYRNDLAAARAEGDLYDIARALQVAQSNGLALEPTPEEAQAMHEELGEVRVGHGSMDLPQGYQLARWLMIHKVLWPGTEEVTDDDIAMMDSAAKEFREQANYYQLASLVQTAKYLGIELDLTELTAEERSKVEEELHTIT